MVLLMIITQCMFVFIATVGFSVIFNVKKSELGYAGLVGVICYFIYKIILVYYQSDFMGAVLGTFAAVLVSRRLAYLRKIPASIYIIPAIIPLAPGGAIYLTMYNIIYGNNVYALKYAFLTLQIAGGIVIGMMIALSFPYSFFAKQIFKKEKR